MIRPKSLLLGASTILLAVLALSCSGESGRDVVAVKLALDWYPNSNHLGLYIAQEKGYFEDENLDVTLYTPVDPSTVLLTVGSGEDHFGISYQPDVLLARGQGVPVVSVAGMVQHPLNSVMALKSSGITRPRDLVGKTVGYPGIPTNEPLLDTMIRFDTNGEKGLDDVKLVNVGFDLAPALIGGRVDAIVGAYWTHESILMENEGYEINIMRMEEWGVPDYYELVLVTSEGYLDKNADVIERFVRAVRKGYQDAVSDPQGGVDTLLTATNQEVDEKIERPGADLLVPMWQSGNTPFGDQQSARWTEFARWMQDNALLAAGTNGGDAFTDRFTGVE